jgi:methylamine--corrinoid protein Co-methyltransferase
MQFWEVAALCIAGLASGRDLFCGGGIRRYKVKPMLGSALENRFHAELGHAATGIKRGDANELVKQIVRKYEKDVTKDGGPWGYTFNEMYDLDTLKPRKEFVQLYEKMKNELEDLGLVFKNSYQTMR